MAAPYRAVPHLSPMLPCSRAKRGATELIETHAQGNARSSSLTVLSVWWKHLEDSRDECMKLSHVVAQELFSRRDRDLASVRD